MPKVSNIGAEKTPKMVRKKNGSLFCFLIPFSHKNVFLIVSLSSPIISLFLMLLCKNDSFFMYLFSIVYIGLLSFLGF